MGLPCTRALPMGRRRVGKMFNRTAADSYVEAAEPVNASALRRPLCLTPWCLDGEAEETHQHEHQGHQAG